MAAAISLSFPLDPQNLHHPFRLQSTTVSRPLQSRFFTRLSPICKYPLTSVHREGSCSFKSFSSSSSSSSSSPSHSSTPTTPTSSYHEDPFCTGRFLSNEEFEKLKFLQDFVYYQQLRSGSLCVRVMTAEQMDMTIGLLAESFAESMVLPVGYVSVLKFLVKQYLMERKVQMPHMATLIGFYKENGEDGEEKETQLAGTVEVCFNKRGASVSPPTPTPPKDSPYICNMAVKKSFRRRGIGWHLLKASEELISQMSSSREAYLHCRMIDEAPLNMYKKADYKIVKTDSILVLLTLQRRKHLMRKRLHLLSNPPESDDSESDSEKSA